MSQSEQLHQGPKLRKYNLFRERPKSSLSDKKRNKLQRGAGGSDTDFILLLLSIRHFNNSYRCCIIRRLFNIKRGPWGPQDLGC